MDTLPRAPKQRRIAMAFRAVFGLIVLICSIMGFDEEEQDVIRLKPAEEKIILDEYAEWRGILPPALGKQVDFYVEGLFPWVSFPMALQSIMQNKINALRKLREERGQIPARPTRPSQPPSRNGQEGAERRVHEPYFDEGLLGGRAV